jgi:hypothetical protein
MSPPSLPLSSSTQHNTTQHNTTQHNTTQHNTTHKPLNKLNQLTVKTTANILDFLLKFNITGFSVVNFTGIH